ncbi:MAG: DNA cytosine methyltransferase, partial [bacterium]|nr:DNA cytosine methyltransferase [bacterium]
LWPPMFDLIKKHKPRWIVGENVTGIINMALDDVLSDLESENYTSRAFIIPACAVNAQHRRNRVWIIAHSNSNSQPTCAKNEEEQVENAAGMRWNGRNRVEEIHEKQNGKRDAFESTQSSRCGKLEAVSNATSERQQGQGEFEQPLCEAEDGERKTNKFESIGIGEIWSTEPSVGRVANGIPQRMDRLKSLGNAVVPQIPEIIGRIIMEIENDR